MFKKIAKLSHDYPKRVLWATGLFLIAAMVLASQATTVLKIGGFNDPNAQSTKAQELIDQNFNGRSNLAVVVEAKQGNVDTTSVRQTGLELTERLEDNDHASNTTSYWQTGAPTLRSEDGRYALITTHIKGTEQEAATEAGQLKKALEQDTTSVSVKLGGQAAVDDAINGEVKQSLIRAEAIAVPLVLLFLLAAFGTVVSALMPLVIALITTIVMFAVLFLLGQATDVAIYSTNLVTALGLGLAVDYALFIVSRYREELRGGASTEKAIDTTVRTAGRTVAFSAAAVATALAVMAIFPLYFLRSFAYAGIGVALISAIAAIVVLPALLRVLGPRLEKGRLPWADVVSRVETRLWGRIAKFVMRRPLLTSLPVIAMFVFLASPLQHINFATPDERVLPPSNSVREAGDALRTAFSHNVNNQLQVVVTADNGGEAAAQAAADISRLEHVNDVMGAGSMYVDGRPVATYPTPSTEDMSLLSVQTNVDPHTDEAADLVGAVRAVETSGSSEMYVDGSSARLVDTKEAISSRLPAGIAIVALITFVVLFLFTGSITQPLRALVTNTLTLAASFGVIVWIFQQGHFADLLNFTATPLEISMPVLLFCIAFGLSMDYEMFVLSRIKEQHDKGASNDEAVVHGLARAGRIVSTAAAILAVSFFAFGTATLSFIQLLGIGTGLAILLDATLVRGVLVPAFMHKMRDAAWYSPKWLRRVHDRIGQIEG